MQQPQWQQQQQRKQDENHVSIISSANFAKLVGFIVSVFVVCPQLHVFVPVQLQGCLNHKTNSEDNNNHVVVLPMCLMVHWAYNARKKWEKLPLFLVFCLSAVVFIEFYCHVPPEQVSSSFQHVLRGWQRDLLSVILLLLWLQMSVYLFHIAYRGIGRQFYAIQETLCNTVVLTYFLFIFIM